MSFKHALLKCEVTTKVDDHDKYMRNTMKTITELVTVVNDMMDR